MIASWIINFCFILGVLSALVAGLFLTFSDFVMRGLALSSPASGIESMQNINRTVFRSILLTSFFALIPALLSISLYALTNLNGIERTLILLASIVYFVLVFMVTLFRNVPMNKKLDLMNNTDKSSEIYWRFYCRAWTRWNHLRTLGSLITSLCLLSIAIDFF